ncbi:N-acetyltransferase family protein [Leptolyngbya sp. AN02str]|uniref:GNAT family N-acetyltransferase n=1 Tax=Leptolyngbya sp. AN02str TaxID=3423363 RepID=UPI003D3156D5
MHIEELTVGGLWSHLDALVEAYFLAFSAPPYHETQQDADSFRESLLEIQNWQGFRCVVAYEDISNRMVGFACGHSCLPGRWWADMIAQALGPERTKYWLADGFEFVELAVIPSHQRRGIGGRLHDRLLTHLPHRTAVLSTMAGNGPAIALYQQRGWQPLIPEFTYPHGRVDIIWGRALRLF